jgi:hypothetical protein
MIHPNAMLHPIIVIDKKIRHKPPNKLMIGILNRADTQIPPTHIKVNTDKIIMLCVDRGHVKYSSDVSVTLSATTTEAKNSDMIRYNIFLFIV